MIFPIEIWEKIFLFADDPIDLLKLKIVCKCWKEIIDRLLRDTDLWHQKCKEDIPTDVWDTIFEKLFPYNTSTNYEKDRLDSDTWMILYKLWINLKGITKSDITIETLEPLAVHRPSEVITCAKVSKSLLAVGSSEGYIYFFDITDLEKHMLYRADHMERVCDIQFYTEENNLVAVSASVNHSVKFWDLTLKEQIKSRTGKMICASYGYCYTLIGNILLVEGPVSKMLYQLDLHDLVAMTAHKDNVFLYSESGHYATIQIGSGDRESCTMRLIKPPVLNTRRYFLFKNNVILCIAECGLLGVSEKGKDWQMYNIFPFLYGIPTAVLIYANLLILGLDLGEVHIFNVETFETLDFETMESKKITLDAEPIISLDIVILLAEPCLIVASSKKVYVIKFI